MQKKQQKFRNRIIFLVSSATVGAFLIAIPLFIGTTKFMEKLEQHQYENKKGMAKMMQQNVISE